MKYWRKLTPKEIKERIQEALNQNVDYHERTILGIPASHLDENVFNKDATYLNNAPFLKTMVDNPNHIGCHTMGESEPFLPELRNWSRNYLELLLKIFLNANKVIMMGMCHQEVQKPTYRPFGFIAIFSKKNSVQTITKYVFFVPTIRIIPCIKPAMY